LDPRGSGLKAEELIVKDPANPGNGRSWLAFIGTSDGVYLTKHLGNPHGASVLSNSLLADNVYQYRESVFPTRQAAHQERGSAHFYMPWMSFGNFRQRVLADALVFGA